jgi:hypothetical protein
LNKFSDRKFEIVSFSVSRTLVGEIEDVSAYGFVGEKFDPVSPLSFEVDPTRNI